jgi:hypothetical protein
VRRRNKLRDQLLKVLDKVMQTTQALFEFF